MRISDAAGGRHAAAVCGSREDPVSPGGEAWKSEGKRGQACLCIALAVHCPAAACPVAASVCWHPKVQAALATKHVMSAVRYLHGFLVIVYYTFSG